MLKKICFALAFLIPSIGTAQEAQTGCGSIEQVVAGLEKFGEELVSVGTVLGIVIPPISQDATEPTALLIFMNQKTGAFTSVVYNTKTNQCTMVLGKDFMSLPIKPEKKGEPA